MCEWITPRPDNGASVDPRRNVTLAVQYTPDIDGVRTLDVTERRSGWHQWRLLDRGCTGQEQVAQLQAASILTDRLAHIPLLVPSPHWLTCSSTKTLRLSGKAIFIAPLAAA